MDFPRHISPRITQIFEFNKEETVETFLLIVLLLNLRVVVLGWRYNNRR